MKTSTIILLCIGVFILVAFLFASFFGIGFFGELSSTSSVRDVSENRNTVQNDLPANTNDAVQFSPLLSPDAIRLDALNGKSCYFVELSKIEPEHDPALKTYRFVVDFGPFGDTCVQLFPPDSPLDGHDLFPKKEYGGGKRIGDTTFREYIYQYE